MRSLTISRIRCAGVILGSISLLNIPLTFIPTAVAAQKAEANAVTPAVVPKSNVIATEGTYYVEFRAATIGAYGHSYAVYGSVGGKPHYVDLHPMGNYAIMALGHVLPVPANTEWDPDVLKLPVASSYRKSLNAHQYGQLLAAIKKAKTNKAPYWNAVTNNCNHFIGQLADAVGLRVPGSFQFSYMFVPALKTLNEDAGVRTSTGIHKRRPPSLLPPS